MDHGVITIIILLFAAVMFAWEKIPLSMTSMIVCVSLTLTGVLSPTAAFAGFANKNVILFGAMFVVGGALFQTGMAKKIGGIVHKFAKTELQLIITIMVVTGLLSGVLSNTGTAAILMPVVIGIAEETGYSRARLLMPLMLAAAMGGNITLIGAPGNMIAASTLTEFNPDMSLGFFEFAKIGLPILAAGTIFFGFIGNKFLPEHTEISDEHKGVGEVIDHENVPAWKQKMSLLILVITIFGMIFQKKIGIPLHVIGTIGAILLVVSGVLSEKEAFKAIDLKTIFLFGGVLPLASALAKTGGGKIIADNVIKVVGDSSNPLIIVAVLFLIGCTLTNFMSNTATTALLAPIGVSIAQRIGADPKAVLMAIVIGGSCAYATPIGMPANAMILGPGGFKFNDYVKSGVPLIFVSFTVSMILLPILFPLFPG